MVPVSPTETFCSGLWENSKVTKPDLAVLNRRCTRLFHINSRSSANQLDHIGRGHDASLQSDRSPYMQTPFSTEIRDVLECGVWRHSTDEYTGHIDHFWDPIQPHPRAKGLKPIVVGGMVYFVPTTDIDVISVLSLDLSTGEWTEHQGPRVHGHVTTLTETLHGCLCVIVSSGTEAILGVWLCDVADGYRWHCATEALGGSRDMVEGHSSTRIGYKDGSITINYDSDGGVKALLLDRALRVTPVQTDRHQGDVSLSRCDLKAHRQGSNPLTVHDPVSGVWWRPDNVPDDLPHRLVPMAGDMVLALGDDALPYLVDLRECISHVSAHAMLCDK
ncbi:hypothetical protein KIPB_001168 [Kipferlia bialata]|uniref:Uncharacterized protein n=1 Tax=Kipferlia bialata TaxID=797122 RepID=A0A391NP04_9EUKA|nr:hypothetical protein KIPB_001168 [Kipferlia bialata]|eukprot:g1168.t1